MSPLLKLVGAEPEGQPTAEQILAAAEQKREREGRLRDALVRLGRLNEEAVERIAVLQRQSNAPFAKAASKLGLLTRDDIETAIGFNHGFIREGEGEGRLPANLVIVRRPQAKEAEQFRALRTRLLTSKEGELIGLFAIAAYGAHEGADHIALNMAASFAQLRKRVLILDADLRATRLSRAFALEAGPGLRETLLGECDIRHAIRPTIVSNLSVLTAGAPDHDAHELLSCEALRLTLEYLRCAFDVVVVMTAPFGAVADAQFVWAAAEKAFVVARRHDDRLPALKELNTGLRQVGATVIGAALAG
ncbi:MAG: CpsD/CapB family tyrosine-protein kinase [Parvularculaceae bacterium]|nr:CpsD/CapB family tyrosine-protein kinase [Parvularculaceae bacterium]